MHSRSRILLLATLLALPAGVFATDAHALLQRVAAKYAGAKNVVVRFSEGEGKNRISGVATVEGTAKYRIELNDRIIVCDGSNVWNYTASDKRVTIDKFRASRRTLSPEFFLTQLPADAKVSLAAAGSSKRPTLQLEPANTGDWGFITKLFVEIDESATAMKSVTIEDETGGKRTITVIGTAFNQHLAADCFAFTPPTGATIMDLR